MVNPGLVLRAGIPPVNILELTQSETQNKLASRTMALLGSLCTFLDYVTMFKSIGLCANLYRA